MSARAWTKIEPPERARTYRYADGWLVRFDSVTAVAISESGTHYIETVDGGKHIVAAGWLAIHLDMDSWTFGPPRNDGGPTSLAETEAPMDGWDRPLADYHPLADEAGGIVPARKARR